MSTLDKPVAIALVQMTYGTNILIWFCVNFSFLFLRNITLEHCRPKEAYYWFRFTIKKHDSCIWRERAEQAVVKTFPRELARAWICIWNYFRSQALYMSVTFIIRKIFHSVIRFSTQSASVVERKQIYSSEFDFLKRPRNLHGHPAFVQTLDKIQPYQFFLHC